jgi:adenylate kinase
MTGTRLIFLGPPGTGKGTQAQRLCQTHGWAALSSGDALRREIRDESDIGRQAAQYVEAGTLVPDDVVTGVMLSAIDRMPPGGGFVLDGFPRTLPQAEALGRGLEQRGLKIDAVLDFRMDDDRIVRRIVNRRVCTKCDATYNLEFLRPRVAGVCDSCGGALVQRVDDREDVIATRLETYRSQTAPLVDYYTQQGRLHVVNAFADADSVEREVSRVVASLDRSA